MKKPESNSNTIDFESFLDLLHGAKSFSATFYNGTSLGDRSTSPPDTNFFDDIIQELVPAIALRQYRQVKEKVLKCSVQENCDFNVTPYGDYNVTTYSFRYHFSTIDLYDALSAFNLNLKKLKESPVYAE